MGWGEGETICWSYQEANRIYEPSISTLSSPILPFILYNPIPFCLPICPVVLQSPSLIFYYLIYFNPYINYHMAQGKSKKSYGKKGQKKKVVDSLSRKEWFELKAPAPFQSESFGFTCANRTQGLSNCPSIQKKFKTASREELSAPCRLILHPTRIPSTGGRSSSLSTKPREDRPSPPSMEWISLVTS